MSRGTRVRRVVRKRQFVALMSVVAILMVIVPVAVFAKPIQDGPKKVWICHFPAHDAGTTWSGAGVDLDGDYVVAYQPGMPLPVQVDYCESGGVNSPGGGNLILVSVNSLDGHGAQLQSRVHGDDDVDGYPDGYKG